MILTIAVLLTLAAAVVLEGRTIWVCLRAGRSGGAGGLTGLGSRFLASEIWVVALLGLAHGAFAGLLHVLMAAGAIGAVVYFAGWMLRDLCLWVGPRARWQRGLRCGVALGAAGQVLGLAIVVVGSLRALPRAVDAAVLPSAQTLLAVLAVPVLLLAAALQVVLFRLPPAGYFSWEDRADPYAV